MDALGDHFRIQIVLWTLVFRCLFLERFQEVILMDFRCSGHALEPEKPCKFIVGSSKIKVLPNLVKGGLREPPGSIFD